MDSFLKNIGIDRGQNIIVHASFRSILNAFPGINAAVFLSSIQNIIGSDGSLIIPAFTYCFQKTMIDNDRFNRENSASKVGFISEYFRGMPMVIRTSSPTHSFSLWGNVSRYIHFSNSPESPLGNDSALSWLTSQPNSYIFMIGCNFSSMSFLHHLEIIYDVPWKDFFPWTYMNVIPVGISISGEQKLKEVPGCSKSFVNFEKYLLENELIFQYKVNNTSCYYLSIKKLIKDAEYFFKTRFLNLLCEKGSCKACDSRRDFYISSVKGKTK